VCNAHKELDVLCKTIDKLRTERKCTELVAARSKKAVLEDKINDILVKENKKKRLH
jgi:hypothetical protein